MILLQTTKNALLDKLRKWPWTEVSKIALLTAIPLAVGFGSWAANWYSHKNSLKQDYVQLAIHILQSTDNTNVSLRPWAVSLINGHSDIKLDPEVGKQLATGETKWPTTQTVEFLATELKREIEQSRRQQRMSLGTGGIPLPQGQRENLVSGLNKILSQEKLNEREKIAIESLLNTIGRPEDKKALDDNKPLQ